MKFEANATVNGTFLKGYVLTTYDHLVSVLGKPNDEDGDGKVTCEWCIKFEDGTVATVYDWKLGYTPKHVYEWHIGGESQRAVSLIGQILGVQACTYY